MFETCVLRHIVFVPVGDVLSVVCNFLDLTLLFIIIIMIMIITTVVISALVVFFFFF
jgi:hypothetical protein